MERVATTFRLDPAVKEGLVKLSKLERRTLNQLANEAIAEFIEQRLREIGTELQSTQEDLRAYRQRDPNFEHAIEIVVEAETKAAKDPAEGEIT